MYLYVGSIMAIMCIYISLLIDQCPSLTKSRENLTGGDVESGSIGSFDTLKKAHISSSKTPRTSFYLRVGALGKLLSVATRNEWALTKFVASVQFSDWPLWYSMDWKSPCTPPWKASAWQTLFSLIRSCRPCSLSCRCTFCSSTPR